MMMNEQQFAQAVRAQETDPRFPSGPWIGFWVYQTKDRNYMKCGLTFGGGEVMGAGVDVIGQFSMSGKYDLLTGRCVLTKQYEGAHCVHYYGACDDPFWLWGTWQLPSARGGFHIWPEGLADPLGMGLREHLPTRMKGTRRTVRRRAVVANIAPKLSN
jgi:hypothetical protein